MTTTNPWKYVELDKGELKGNPYLNPAKKENGKKPEEAVQTGTPTITNAANFLVLENIVCVGADKKIFERHDRLYVAKDVERNGTAHIDFTPYAAASYFEQKGLFSPSLALTCNIVAVLYKNRNNADIKKVLDQYKDHGAGYGWHAQNTVIDWGKKRIIHYPHDKDFPEAGGDDKINFAAKGRTRTTFGFVVNDDFGDVLLEEALKNQQFSKYIRNLTGLRDPSVLVEIGKYFGQPAKVWVADDPKEDDYTAAAWFGCNGDDLDLGGGSLSCSGAARGVRGERQRAVASKKASPSKKKSSIKKTNGHRK